LKILLVGLHFLRSTAGEGEDIKRKHNVLFAAEIV
jgi:hypothetical protein